MTDGPPVDLIAQICAGAACHERLTGETVVDVDPIDGTCWTTLPSRTGATRVLAALAARGIAAEETSAFGRIHTLGWQARLLRVRLGTLLAGVDDLTDDFDTTAELTLYHYDRRAGAGRIVDPVDVMADIEAALRGPLPMPYQAPRICDIDSLLELVAAAEDAYERLVEQHLAHAEQVLTAQRHMADTN